MSALAILMPIALLLGLLGLVAFLWSLRTGQYDDLEGAAYRAVFDEDDDVEERGYKRKGKKALKAVPYVVLNDQEIAEHEERNDPFSKTFPKCC